MVPFWEDKTKVASPVWVSKPYEDLTDQEIFFWMLMEMGKVNSPKSLQVISYTLFDATSWKQS